MDPKILELRRLVVFEAIWGDETWRKAVAEALPVIESLAASTTVLEKRLATAANALDQANGIVAQIQERLTAAEEGNRELVRRAQQAASERDAAVKLAERRRQDRLDALSVKTTEGLSASEWVLRAGKAERERDELKARCATLSAAGQVQSAHADGNSPVIPDGSDKAHDIYMCHVENCSDCKRVTAPNRPTIAELEAILAAPEGTYRIDVQPNGDVRAVRRYPCSPTCTHDDAATPGHPERVKERSEAFTADDINDTHIASESSGYDKGAEAMRAACWEAALAWAEKERHLSAYEIEQLKAAIEGAAP